MLAGVAPAAGRTPEVARDTGQVLIAPLEYALVHRSPPKGFKPSAAYQWLEIVLEASRRDA